jgi:hypothetical protein
VGWFGFLLVACVPVLYALFWWLDYHWLAESRERELVVPGPDDEV